MQAAALKAEEPGEQPVLNYKQWACDTWGAEGAEPWEDNASPLTSRINTGRGVIESNRPTLNLILLLRILQASVRAFTLKYIVAFILK